jgi:hypothetical protein
LNCRDQLFFSWSRFFSWDCWDCQDASRFLRFVEAYWVWKWCLDRLTNLNEKIQKSTHFSIKIETNCRETPKFSDLDRDFLIWTLMSRRNREVSISTLATHFLTLSRFSQLSRLSLWRCQDRDSRSRQIETPMLKYISSVPLTSMEWGRNNKIDLY